MSRRAMDARVFGREGELGSIGAFLEPVGLRRVGLVLSGEAGYALVRVFG